ncbi:MAG: hypothetical protein HY235_19485 [Acidobacteria bacterium]|nr:hypothetical protein [Acidobacteriota bacterium]
MIALTQTGGIAQWSVFPLAHPNAKLLLGVNWRRIVESPLGPTILKQVKLGGHPLLGLLESIENVDLLLISSPGADNEGRPPLLVIAEGRFSLSKVRAMAMADGAVSRRYNDVELLVPPNATSTDLHFALIDGNTILFGDGLSVKAAIDRWQRMEDTYEKNPLFVRARSLSGVQQVWMLASSPSEALSSLGFGGSGLAEQIDSLEIGISAGQQLTASLLMKASTPEAADTLATGLPALLQLAAITYSSRPAWTQLAKRLKVMTENEYIKMGVSLDARLLDQSLNELRGSAATAAAAAAAAPAAVAAISRPELPAPTSELTRKVVRIISEDGTREIPYEPRKQE